MPRGILYRALLVIGLTLWAVLYLAPSLTTALPEWWPSFLPSRKIRLGLDLRGGTHLLLSVDLEKAIENALDQNAEDLRRVLREANVTGVEIQRVGQSLRVRATTQEGKNAAEKILSEQFPTLTRTGAPAPAEGEISVVSERREVQRLREYALDQSLETIRNRIDQFGVAEPTVQRQGSQEILVQLPGIQDPGRAKELIGKTAVLEFKLVAEDNKAPGADGTVVLQGQEVEPLSGQVHKVPYTLEKKTLMTGDVVADARVRPPSNVEGPYVELILNDRGARLFEKITGENVGRRLAIILDNTVYSAPTIREKIGGGRAQITGSFDIKEARDLAIVLRAGALPAPVTIAEERTVGPSLGKDSINQGVLSFVVGGSLVILFMVVYYKVAGVLADLAVILNILYLLAALAAFEATLTLPGIAGIVLTIGMAVDANVLINERMREEVRLGKNPRAAVEAGYERALPAILDSNITTFLSGLILFQFGSGPVKGFAVTLCLGIISSVFTAVVGTRVVYDYLLAKRRLVALSV
ncbi:MAG TPA: protein translocase subunit SecD [Candidatus Binatia bacterium]|jgi:preprotein translocase subunit SecD|nr:protein translocase subunit SecD [Candidatus Binatia bacterium]